MVKEKDVWYAQLGVNIGNEEDGKGNTFKRPVLVIKKFGNMFLVIPMTTGGKDSKFYTRSLKNISAKPLV